MKGTKRMPNTIYVHLISNAEKSPSPSCICPLAGGGGVMCICHPANRKDQ